MARALNVMQLEWGEVSPLQCKGWSGETETGWGRKLRVEVGFQRDETVRSWARTLELQ